MSLTALTGLAARARPGRQPAAAGRRLRRAGSPSSPGADGTGAPGDVLWGSQAARRARAGRGCGRAGGRGRSPGGRSPPVAAAALIYLWPTMFGGAQGRGRAGRAARGAGHLDRVAARLHRRVDRPRAGDPALADRGAAESSSRRCSGWKAGCGSRSRSRRRWPRFAEEFDDASADLVVAALILNSKLRGPGLVATLTALWPPSAREEIDMRRRIEEGRKSLRRTAMIIVGVTALFAGGLAVFSRDYVAPYSTAARPGDARGRARGLRRRPDVDPVGRQPAPARAVPGRRRPGRRSALHATDG